MGFFFLGQPPASDAALVPETTPRSESISDEDRPDSGVDRGGREAQLPNRDVVEFMAQRFELAKLAYEEGNFKKAWQLCEAILYLAPELPFRKQLRSLRREAQGRFIAQSVVIVSFQPDDDLALPCLELRGDVTIENYSNEPIVIGRFEEDPVFGMLKFELRTLSGYSFGESVQVLSRVVRMPEEILVESGGVYQLPFSLPLEELASEGTLLQQWSLTGSLRPISVKLGRDVLTRGVPWIPSQGVLVPEDLAEVPSDPLQHLRQALLTGDGRRFLVASALWWSEIEEDGVEQTAELRAVVTEELLSSLGANSGLLDLASIRLLEKLTGVFRERTAESWIIWSLTRPKKKSLNGRGSSPFQKKLRERE